MGEVLTHPLFVAVAAALVALGLDTARRRYAARRDELHAAGVAEERGRVEREQLQDVRRQLRKVARQLEAMRDASHEDVTDMLERLAGLEKAVEALLRLHEPHRAPAHPASGELGS